MDVGMRSVNMGYDEESVIPLRPAHGEFVADPIGRFRVDLAGLEALAQMIRQHVAFAIISSGDGRVLILGKQKLRVPYLLSSVHSDFLRTKIFQCIAILPIPLRYSVLRAILSMEFAPNIGLRREPVIGGGIASLMRT